MADVSPVRMCANRVGVDRRGRPELVEGWVGRRWFSRAVSAMAGHRAACKVRY